MDLVMDAIIELLPKEAVSLKPVDTSQFDNLCQRLWVEHGIVAVHFQDKREGDAERAVLSHVATRKWGRRVV